MSISNKKIQGILPIVGFVVIVVIVFGRALIPPAGQLIFGDDIHLTYYFFRQFFQQFMREGIVPWWNPYLFAGQPIMAHPQALLMFHPINWLFVFLSVPLAVSLYLAFHVLLAMFGMFWLLRQWIRPPAGGLAAWVGGLVFGLSGFFMSRIWAGHLDMIAAASYVPIVFGLFYQVIHEGTRRQIVFAGIALALQLLVGYQSMALYTLDAVGIMLLLSIIRIRSLKPLMRVIVSGLLGLGIAAVQLVPEWEFIQNSIRTFELPYLWSSRTSMPVQALRLFLQPFAYGTQQLYTGPWPNLAEYLGFIGLVPLALALIGVIWVMVGSRGRKSEVLLLITIAVFGIWMSLGSNAPVDLLKLFWQNVPLYNATRIPSRHLVLTVFGLSALTAFGIQSLRNRALRVIATIVILWELVPFARSFIELREIPERRHDPALLTILKEDRSMYRILPNFGVWLPPRDSLDFDSAMSYRFYSTTGYDPSILRNYYEFIDAVNGATQPSILEHDVQVPYLDISSPYTDFLNVKYLFVSQWADSLGGVSTDRFVLLREDPERSYRLYENRMVIPRFFLVPRIHALPDREAVAQAIREGSVDPAKTVLVSQMDLPKDTNPHDCPDTIEGSVFVRAYSPNAITLDITSPCNAVLATSEVMYPGWETFIDGEKSFLFEGNLAFRTLYIPKGEHTVILRYNPRIFLIGAGVSLVTILFLFAWNFGLVQHR